MVHRAVRLHCDLLVNPTTWRFAQMLRTNLICGPGSPCARPRVLFYNTSQGAYAHPHRGACRGAAISATAAENAACPSRRLTPPGHAWPRHPPGCCRRPTHSRSVPEGARCRLPSNQAWSC